MWIISFGKYHYTLFRHVNNMTYVQLNSQLYANMFNSIQLNPFVFFSSPSCTIFLRKWYFGDVQSWCFYIPIIWRLWLLEAHLGQWQSPLYPNRLKAPKSPPAGEGRNVSHTITSQYYCRVHDTVLLLAIFSRQNFQDPPSEVRSSV